MNIRNRIKNTAGLFLFSHLNPIKAIWMRTISELYEYHLHYIYSAEIQLVEGLSIMASKATNRLLNEVLEIQLEKTKDNKQALSKLVQGYLENNREVTCLMVQAYLRETQEFIQGATHAEVLNVGLMVETQRLVHFKISIYSAALYYTNILNYQEDTRVLSEILDGEHQNLITVASLEKDQIY